MAGVRRGWAALQVPACLAPGPDDIVLPKTSSSVFCSTNVDYILRRCLAAPAWDMEGCADIHCCAHYVLLSLRSLGVRFLILAGCVTDQCVESAVRDACDKHYYVTLVTGEPLFWSAICRQRPAAK
jgi:ureidoacrylate peracid hydrolase